MKQSDLYKVKVWLYEGRKVSAKLKNGQVIELKYCGICSLSDKQGKQYRLISVKEFKDVGSN